MSDNQSKSIANQILERIKALEEMLKLALLEKKLDDLTKRVTSITSGGPLKADQFLANHTSKLKARKTDHVKEALDNLEEFTTVKKDKNGKRTFLLHRPTPNFEYGKFADDHNYETTKDTDWIGEIEAAESQQKDKNPVVSIWVHEDSVLNITGAEANSGTWGELGTNPHATKYKIWIKPGKYEIYRELRQ